MKWTFHEIPVNDCNTDYTNLPKRVIVITFVKVTEIVTK